jgi:hypothetical protein
MGKPEYIQTPASPTMAAGSARYVRYILVSFFVSANCISRCWRYHVVGIDYQHRF